MLRYIRYLAAFLCLVSGALSAGEPGKVRGKALYELMGKGGLTSRSGSGPARSNGWPNSDSWFGPWTIGA